MRGKLSYATCDAVASRPTNRNVFHRATVASDGPHWHRYNDVTTASRISGNGPLPRTTLSRSADATPPPRFLTCCAPLRLPSAFPFSLSRPCPLTLPFFFPLRDRSTRPAPILHDTTPRESLVRDHRVPVYARTRSSQTRPADRIRVKNTHRGAARDIRSGPPPSVQSGRLGNLIVASRARGPPFVAPTRDEARDR